jgi:hypothetical protein
MVYGGNGTCQSVLVKKPHERCGERGGEEWELFVRQSVRQAELPTLCSEEKQLSDNFCILRARTTYSGYPWIISRDLEVRFPLVAVIFWYPASLSLKTIHCRFVSVRNSVIMTTTVHCQKHGYNAAMWWHMYQIMFRSADDVFRHFQNYFGMYAAVRVGSCYGSDHLRSASTN